MEELLRYYKDANWQYLLDNVVNVELNKHWDFYNEIKVDGYFDDDIYKALAALSSYLFFGKISNYKEWVHQKHKMLDGYTPLEILNQPEGLKSLKEYILRYPKI